MTRRWMALGARDWRTLRSMGTRTTIAGVLGLAWSLAIASSAAAQARSSANVAGGYSFLRELETPGATYATGWTASFAATPPGGLGWVAEAGANYRQPAGVPQHLLALLGGARFTGGTRSRVVPFAQALAGLERYSEIGFAENGFAVQPGGGIDVWVADRLALRAEVDYRWVRASQQTFNEVRVAAGLAYALGKR